MFKQYRRYHRSMSLFIYDATQNNLYILKRQFVNIKFNDIVFDCLSHINKK